MGERAIPSATLLAFSLWLPSVSCEEYRAPTRGGPTEPSPNASILPAPLAPGLESRDDAGRTERDGGRSALDADAGTSEPHALRQDRALPTDSVPSTVGVSLSARFRWPDVPQPAHVAELNADAVQRARDEASFSVVVQMGGPRTRFTIASRTFTLPAGSELRTRDEFYGYLLLWPGRNTYTVLAPGTLRALFAEQRADVVPLVRPRQSPLGRGNLLGLPTERVQLSTPTGRVELEQGRFNGAAASGASLCRLLLEFIAATSSLVCKSELMPLRADYLWPSGGRFTFEVTHLARRGDLEPSTLAVPPASAEFRQSELPPSGPSLLFAPEQLGEFRTRAVPRSEHPDAQAPKAGVLAVNHSEDLRYLVLDGVPVAWLRPGAELLIPGPRAGKYQLVARDFFGIDAEPASGLDVPLRFAMGDELDSTH